MHTSPIVCSVCSFIKDMFIGVYLQIDVCAVYTDVPTYVHGSSSVLSCLPEIMHVCACKYVYAMVCLYAD